MFKKKISSFKENKKIAIKIKFRRKPNFKM